MGVATRLLPEIWSPEGLLGETPRDRNTEKSYWEDYQRPKYQNDYWEGPTQKLKIGLSYFYRKNEIRNNVSRRENGKQE